MNDTTFQGSGKIAFVPVVVNAKQHKQTNADKIRSMTDKELASIFANLVDCQYCGVKTMRCSENETRCRAEWLAWLKSPVEEVDNG